MTHFLFHSVYMQLQVASESLNSIALFTESNRIKRYFLSIRLKCCRAHSYTFKCVSSFVGTYHTIQIYARNNLSIFFRVNQYSLAANYVKVVQLTSLMHRWTIRKMVVISQWKEKCLNFLKRAVAKGGVGHEFRKLREFMYNVLQILTK